MRIPSGIKDKMVEFYNNSCNDLEIRFFAADMPIYSNLKEPCNPLSWSGELSVSASATDFSIAEFTITGELVANELFNPKFARICKKTDDGSKDYDGVRFDVKVGLMNDATPDIKFPYLPLNKGDTIVFTSEHIV